MARPRIFISSTYYDLKNVRADLERYIRERGFEPVLHERGNIPYGHQEKLEKYCYKEIELCDIVIAIIGGRYGSPSEENSYSISQKELKTAIDLGKPVYIFVEKSVLAEYHTYEINKNNPNIQYAAVDDVRVYHFLEEIKSLPINNPIAPFETSSDIINYLQEQWAGLFQRLLQESARQKEIRILEDMKAAAETLNRLVTFLTEERRKGDQAIRDILLTSHPIFGQLKKLLNIPYRVFFVNLDELNAWLSARNFEPVEKEQWDDENIMEWISTKRGKKKKLLKISSDIFEEDGRLKIFTPEEWDPEKVQLVDLKDDDDEFPF